MFKFIRICRSSKPEIAVQVRPNSMFTCARIACSNKSEFGVQVRPDSLFKSGRNNQDTGLRVSELCSLTPQHILWQEKSLRITGKGGPHGQKSKKRVVPMSKRVQALLEPYFSLHEEWFMGVRQMQKIVKKVANKAQISRPVTPHILRHTFATLALQKGLSLAAVQKILGHDQLATTAIYLNLTDTHVAEEFDKKW